MNKKILLLFAVIPAIIFGLMLEPKQAQAGGGAMNPIYTVTELDVYQSSTDTLDDGTPICQNVDITAGGTCSGTLNAGTTYQFEFTVTNGPDANGSPNNMEFRSTIGAGDVLGSSPTLGNGGCETNNNWSMSIVTTRVDGNAGTTCTITKNSQQEFWMIITIDPDTCDGTATATFFIDDGTITDESGTITFNCASASSPTINIDQIDVFECLANCNNAGGFTTLESGNDICLNVDTDSPQTCQGTLMTGHVYRIEIEVDETGGVNYTPTSFDIDSSVGSFDLAGNLVSAEIYDSGCNTNTNWSESIVSIDMRSSSGTTCTINSSTGEWWMVFKLESDAGGGTNPTVTFTITDGTTSDTSESITFIVSSEG